MAARKTSKTPEQRATEELDRKVAAHQRAQAKLEDLKGQLARAAMELEQARVARDYAAANPALPPNAPAAAAVPMQAPTGDDAPSENELRG